MAKQAVQPQLDQLYGDRAGDQISHEWLAWRQVCKQLQSTGIDPKSPKYAPLMGAIHLWGEERVRLYMGNGVQYKADELLATRRNEYTPHVIGVPGTP